jgi:peptidoglycan/xylan/chitin deacetylase (PgdA/CDA1 family)
MRFYLKSFITFLYSSFALGSNKEGLRVLKYHSINNEPINKHLWNLDMNFFSDHLSCINEKRIKVYKTNELISSIPNQGLVITFDDGFRDNFEIAAPLLFKLNMPFSVFVITDFVSQSRKEYVDEVMLKEFAEHPLVTIGSHSCSHAKLTNCNLTDMKNEISDSKHYLEDLVGKEINTFSYPHGLFNEAVRKEVIKSGYKLGFTSHFDINLANKDKFTLNTTELWNTDNLTNFKKKINGDWDWLKYRNL